MAQFGHSPKDIRWHAIAELLYGCGLRVSECAALTMNQVDLELGMLRIWGKGNKERLVPMPKQTIKLYANMSIPSVRYIRKPTSWLFITRLGKKNDYCFHRKYDKISVYPGRNSEADHAA